jgi:hypothetical protein
VSECVSACAMVWVEDELGRVVLSGSLVEVSECVSECGGVSDGVSDGVSECVSECVSGEVNSWEQPSSELVLA